MMTFSRTAALFALIGVATAFTPISLLHLPRAQSKPATSATEARMFFADDATEEKAPSPARGSSAAPAEANTDIKVLPSSGDASSIRQAAAFMVEYFWLSSPQNLLAAGDDPSSLSEAAKATLVEEQDNDLTETYGEIMGTRTLESCLLTAEDDGGLLGLVGIETKLYNKSENQVISAEKSQALLKNAIASLGPKQRRQYKDSSAAELVTELLPPELQLVCTLSNLSVSPRSRRRGVAMRLCQEAEKLAKEEWNFDSMCLLVEKKNEAARSLYETKLGYELIASDPSASGLRVDVDNGCFVEQGHETLTLRKAL